MYLFNLSILTRCIYAEYKDALTPYLSKNVNSFILKPVDVSRTAKWMINMIE